MKKDSDSDIEEDQRALVNSVADLNEWEESLSFDDEGVTTFKALMAVSDEELSVGRSDARSGQWVEITMKKVQKLLFMTKSDERKHVLDYTHVDIHYVDDQRKNLLGKLNSLKQEFSSCKSELTDLKNTKALNSSHQNEITKLSLENESLKDEISDLKKVIEKWTSSRITLDQLLTEQVPGNIVKALGGKGIRKEKFTSKEVCRIPYITSLHITITNLRSRREKES
ncbi:hypothetical protein Tco_1054600 [Tanacetum coccineum]|uniref:Retrovirus-related Pol polyprotein from transposon TNT 1-94 n=1 Tax=Tanacetum coccineum TaxID=301880 RepID=A0ABQ5GZN0_9ASTR